MHFHRLFEIETGAFTAIAPRPDAVNEMIGGDEVARWLHTRLCEAGHACEPIVAEDHGWDFEVTAERRRYLVVSSCEFIDETTPADLHLVQVAQRRGEALDPDPLLQDVRRILSANAAFKVDEVPA